MGEGRRRLAHLCIRSFADNTASRAAPRTSTLSTGSTSKERGALRAAGRHSWPDS
jgi:hypothetical protein